MSNKLCLISKCNYLKCIQCKDTFEVWTTQRKTSTRKLCPHCQSKKINAQVKASQLKKKNDSKRK